MIIGVGGCTVIYIMWIAAKEGVGMRIKVILMMVVATLLLCSVTAASAQQKVYRWVDKNGVVHFADMAGKYPDAEIIDIQNNVTTVTETAANPEPAATDSTEAAAPPPSYAQQRRDERAQKRKENAELQSAIKAGCEQRRKLVAQLEPSPRVMIKNEDGDITRMDDDARLKILSEAKAYIAAQCDK